MFRTYDCGIPPKSERADWDLLNSGPASTSQIWEVARATSAAPTFFPPMHCDNNIFIDGGLTANNPTQEALREIAFLHGDLSGAIFVSIGSGVSKNALPTASILSSRRQIWPDFQKKVIQLLRERATQTEMTSADVQFEARMNTNFSYFRFNTASEVSIRFDDWDAPGRTRTELELILRDSLESQEMKANLRECAFIIANRLAKGSQFHTGNRYFLVPRTPSSLFTGRTETLDYIRQCLTSKKKEHVGLPRTVVVTGMGGQGKSELCLKLVHDMRER